ncbi:MAG: Holliday junction branch migration protein RuvA [Fimbriimonadaceae bacterium]|nr:Holliday junction branch migration protein RuvA [Fimbriimonadaceae bacterium]QYK57761.1 MAG: Holliday junction branch migration protein RuvA [Fimbriimonadaceae bacterium]
MIARLRGEVIENSGVGVVVDCGGVGYEVSVPEILLFGLPVGTRTDLYVRQITREDGTFLYGFSDRRQRQVFDLLREVKGCGPKTSLAVLSALGDDGFTHAVATQDAHALSKAPGVGPRLAERIIVELKDKIFEPEAKAAVAVARPKADDLVEALLSLGYRRSEAETVATEARTEADDLEAQIKASLRRLAR